MDTNAIKKGKHESQYSMSKDLKVIVWLVHKKQHKEAQCIYRVFSQKLSMSRQFQEKGRVQYIKSHLNEMETCLI